MESHQLDQASNEQPKANLLDNVAHPLVNDLLIKPRNAVLTVANLACDPCIFAANHIGGLNIKSNPLHMTELYALPNNDFGSAGWWEQSLSEAAGSIVPFVVAGKCATEAMGGIGRAVGAEESAGLFASARLGQVLGAGVYEGLQKPEAGQTRVGNALGTAAMFGAFELGNPWIAEKLPLAGSAVLGRWTLRCVGQAGIGMVGGMAQYSAAHIASGQPVSWSQFSKAGMTGAAMNLALPAITDGITRGGDYVNSSLGRGIPVRTLLSRQDFSYRLEQDLDNAANKDPLLRIQKVEGDEPSSINYKKRLINWNEANGEGDLFHELNHIQKTSAQQWFSRQDVQSAIAALKRGDRATAWQNYAKARLGTEMSARLSERAANSYAQVDPAAELKWEQQLKNGIPHVVAGDGMTYNQLWQRDFQRFADSNGSTRPIVDFKGGAVKAAEQAAPRALQDAATVLKPAADSRAPMRSFRELGQVLGSRRAEARAQTDARALALKQQIGSMYESATDHQRQIGELNNKLKMLEPSYGWQPAEAKELDGLVTARQHALELERQYKELMPMRAKYARLCGQIRRLETGVNLEAGDQAEATRALIADKTQERDVLHSQIEQRASSIGGKNEQGSPRWQADANHQTALWHVQDVLPYYDWPQDPLPEDLNSRIGAETEKNLGLRTNNSVRRSMAIDYLVDARIKMAEYQQAVDSLSLRLQPLLAAYQARMNQLAKM